MIFNFSELRVYFQRRLRGVVYGTARAAVNLAKETTYKARADLGGTPIELIL